MSGITKHLREVVSLSALLENRYSQIGQISADDEFEVEYLVEGILKDLESLKKVSDNYKDRFKDVKLTEHSGVTDGQKLETRHDNEGNTCAGKLHTDWNIGDSNDAVEETDSVIIPGDLEEQTTGRHEPDNEEDAASDVTEDYDSQEHQESISTQDEPCSQVSTYNSDVNDVLEAFLEDEDDDCFEKSAMALADEAEQSYADESKNSHEDEDVEDEDDLLHQPPDKRYLEVLKKYFGYAKFRPMQWKIVNTAINEKRDQCVVMATGYGKSLCYQYPSVYTGKSTVVISPLISLMEDQVLALSTVNISACFLGSAQTDTQSVTRGILMGEYRVIYITPEYAELDKSLLVDLNNNVGIDLIAIDEAHCVSQWGHDFRGAYRNLGRLRDKLNVPIMALTATATPEVRRDICRSLKLTNPAMICTDFDRPNLYLSVCMKSGDIMSDLKSKMAREKNRYSFDGPCIIYCPTKKDTENVNNVVKMLGLKSGLYHAGLSLNARKEAHRGFVNDKLEVIVATVAFGMGIDKPDVRNVIHYGAPKDLECYYQEMGRAGRDGQNSKCHVFYNHGDFNTNRFFLKDINNTTFRAHKTKMLHKMEEYLATTGCRRRTILSHFENKDVTKIGGTDYCCDNCDRQLRSRANHGVEKGGATGAASLYDEEVNYGKEARDFLKAVQTLGERYGMALPISFLMGSSTQKLPQKYQQHRDHGSGRYKTQAWWKAFGMLLKIKGYLDENMVVGGFGATLSLSTKAHNWLSKNLSSDSPVMTLLPSQEMISMDPANKVKLTLSTGAPKILPTVPANTWLSTKDMTSSRGAAVQSNVDPRTEKLQGELYKVLLRKRDEISTTQGIPVFRVFTNKTLMDMTVFRPTTIENISSMEEVAEERARKYGKYFTDTIHRFCSENNWESDKMPADEVISAKLDSKLRASFLRLTETQQSSYMLFEREGKSLEVVAASRGFKSSTIVSHLAGAIKEGLPVDIERLGVTEKMIRMVTDVIRKPPINSDISRLTPIKDQLPDWIDFGHIRVVVSILERQFGLNSQGHIDEDENEIPQASGSLATASTSYGSLSKSQSCQSTAEYRRSTQTSSTQNSQDIGGKRKLPDWMNKPKTTTAKKIKKNSLFRR